MSRETRLFIFVLVYLLKLFVYIDNYFPLPVCMHAFPSVLRWLLAKGLSGWHGTTLGSCRKVRWHSQCHDAALNAKPTCKEVFQNRVRELSWLKLEGVECFLQWESASIWAPEPSGWALPSHTLGPGKPVSPQPNWVPDRYRLHEAQNEEALSMPDRRRIVQCLA